MRATPDGPTRPAFPNTTDEQSGSLSRTAPNGRAMRLHSVYTPEGAFQYLLLGLLASLLGAVGFLLVYTNAAL